MKTKNKCPLWIVGIALVLNGTIAMANDTGAFDKQMQSIVEAYLKIPAALAADKTDGVLDAAKTIAKLASKLDSSSVTGENRKYYTDLPAKLEKAALAMVKTQDVDSMREALKELSKPMALWATLSKPAEISIGYCSMARGSWLQWGNVIANPYYGTKMPRCGEFVSSD
jgi:Cu(I)/Ag(I) efflux system membrane fusion protein